MSGRPEAMGRALRSCLLVLAGLAAAAGAGAAPGPGDAAPELAVSGCHNPAAPVSLAQLRGKVVLLDFWGIWCSPASRRSPSSTR